MAALAIPDNRVLPKKENDLYKSIAKHYETKQYKKGVKAADTVLKKFPDHGETQCMKALCLSCMDKKDEAFELVKVGLRNDMRSHVCWHVHGLLHRTEKEYPKAVKAYKQALKIDPENMLILRDNSFLQIQIRDYEGFLETRRQILVLKPQNKTNWMAFAVAQHLAGHIATAISIIDKYTDTLEGQTRVADMEEAELMLYKCDLLMEIEDYPAAAKHLEDNKDYIVDAYGCISKQAELQLLMGEYEKARESWKSLLLNYSAENYATHRGWQCALLELDLETVKSVMKLKALDLVSTVLGNDMTTEQRTTLTNAYKEIAVERPRSRAIRRIPLTFLTGSEFEDKLRSYITKMVHDGVPALGAELSSLYTVQEDNPQSVTGDMGSSHPQALSLGHGLMVRCKDPKIISQHPTYQLVLKIATEIYEQCLLDDANLAPATLLWCMFLMSQLEEARGEFASALSFIERCIEHTPTAVDMYERRGRLLRKSGDIQGASLQMEVARKLDLADRYINNKSAKYLLRCGQRTEALDTVGLFTKHDGSVENNLRDMQVLWFENESGYAALRLGEIGPALKKFRAIEKHFTDYIDDQFDFHSYCIRRQTLRSYSACLQMSDNLQHHRSYQRAACGAVACYLRLHDDPSLKNPNAAAAEEAVDMSNMSAAEKKKAKLLARKAKAKQEAGAKAKAAEASAAAAEDDNDDKKKCKFPDPVAPPADKDPLGHEYLASCDPLPAAAKLVSALVKFSPKAISTHVCAFDVACRRMKPLQALQALCRGSKISASSPEMILRIAAFALGVECSGLSKSKKTDIPPCPTNASDELKQAWVCAVAVSQACASLESYAVEALLLELSSLIGGATPTDWLASVAATGAASSLPIGIAVARGSLLLAKFPGANSKAMKVAAVKALLGGGLDRADAKYSVCEEAMKVLQDAEADTTEWKAMCAKRFPISEAFGTVLRPVMGVHEPPDVLE